MAMVRARRPVSTQPGLQPPTLTRSIQPVIGEAIYPPPPDIPGIAEDDQYRSMQGFFLLRVLLVFCRSTTFSVPTETKYSNHLLDIVIQLILEGFEKISIEYYNGCF